MSADTDMVMATNAAVRGMSLEDINRLLGWIIGRNPAAVINALDAMNALGRQAPQGRTVTAAPVTVSDIEAISRAIEGRQTNFAEDLDWSVGVVLMNYGDRYTWVSCIGGEWSGTKADIADRGPGVRGIPNCPNGHPLMEGPGRKILALIDEVES